MRTSIKGWARLGGAALALLAVAGASGARAQDAAKPNIGIAVPGPNAYFDPWRQAAEDATRDFGIDASFQVPPTNAFNLTQQNALLDSLVARNYAGFALFPGDANGTNAQEAKLARRGIATVNINGCTFHPSPALFCLSTDIYKAARYQAEELIKAIGGGGPIALLASQLTDPNTQLRIQAVQDAVAETNGKVTLAQVVADIDTPQLSPPAVNALLAAQREAAVLFKRLHELRGSGSAILFVSHKLEEVFALCDRMTVIRDGKTILDAVGREDVTQREVVTAMVGRSITFGSRVAAISPPDTTVPPRLALRGIGTSFGHRNVDLELRAGEIVGLYGLVGAGRTELARAVMGLETITQGTLAREGRPLRARSPREAIHTHRIGYVSEDRKGEGLILGHRIRHNVGITIWSRIAGWLGAVTPNRERRRVAQTVDRMSVRLQSLDQPVGQLSGGNQQKISVAKWLAGDVDVLIIDEPTTGVDVRTKEDMYAVIEQLRSLGKAILVISSDLAEIVRISDRIAVMARKTIAWNEPNQGTYEQLREEIMHAIV